MFAQELAGMSDAGAAVVAAALRKRARNMTTGQLRAALKAMVMAADPAAAQKRAERARRQARVEAWQETSGNGAMAGRELPSAEIIAADKRISVIAQALKEAGAEGTMDQLRSSVFLALLTGRDPQSLLPAANTSGGAARPDSSDLARLKGTVNLTMPLSAWAGWTDRPGEVAGHGPVPADTCRELVERLTDGEGEPGSGSGDTAWCLTITDEDGLAAGHACARAGPSGPSGSAGLATWLRSLKITWLDRDGCGHQHQARGYRPGRMLAHLVRIRHRTCAFPGCRQPAGRCDLDHTVPYDQGGPTCLCNLAPLSRRHHRTKQASGWHLAQIRTGTETGTLVWTAPHRRSYTVKPSSYPI